MPCFEQILVDPSRSSKQILDISQGSKCCRALQTCMIRICVQNAQISIYFNMAAMHYASKAVGQRLPICPLRTANSEVESNQTFQAMRFRERVGATLSPLNSLNEAHLADPELSKLLKILETQSKGWKAWNAGSCLQSRCSTCSDRI